MNTKWQCGKCGKCGICKSPFKGDLEGLKFREGLSGVRRRPGAQASPPASPPLKPIKGSLKSKVLMVLYTVFNGK